MSPSPCSVKTSASGRMRFAPVASDGARPCSACTRSTSIVLRERGVAADPDHADRALARSRAPRSPRAAARIASGSPQPGQRSWSSREQQARLEVAEAARGLARRAVDRQRSSRVIASAPLDAARARRRASRCRRRRSPASSLEMPPIASTGTAPSTASRTSSIIWPAFCSSTAIAARARGRARERLRRERPQRDRPEEADARALARAARARRGARSARASRTPPRRAPRPSQSLGLEALLRAPRSPRACPASRCQNVSGSMPFTPLRMPIGFRLRERPLPPSEPSTAQSFAGSGAEVERRDVDRLRRCARAGSRRRSAPDCASGRRGGRRAG